MKNLLPFTETFKWIALESIVGGHLSQMQDNLYSYISWSSFVLKLPLMFCIQIICETKQFLSNSVLSFIS